MNRIPEVALIIAVAVAGALHDPPAVGAQDDGIDAEARILYEAGRLAFDQGRYENAYQRFLSAYELSRRPELLYNLGASADRLRRDTLASVHFRSFLEAQPDSELTAQVRARLAILDRAAASQTRTTPIEEPPSDADEVAAETGSAEIGAAETGDTGAAPTREPALALPEDEDDEESDGGISWALLGVSAGVAAIGGGLVAWALADKASVEDAALDAEWSDVEGAADRVTLVSGFGFGALGLGLVGMIGALVFTGGDDAETERAHIDVGPSGVSISGSF